MTRPCPAGHPSHPSRPFLWSSLAFVMAPSLALALSLALSGPAHANPHRLDDSLSHTVPANAQMQWRPQTGADPDAGVQAWVRVNVRIDTSDWVGRTGRVYMVLPRTDRKSVV